MDKQFFFRLTIPYNIFFSERAARGGGAGGALPDFLFLFIFSCSSDHERDWPPCEAVFFGLATNALNVKQQLRRSRRVLIFL